MTRPRYRSVLGRRYILVRPQSLAPAVAVDVLGYALARLFPRPAAPGPVKRVLAIRLDHIGDVLITTPALRVLRERFETARLDVLAGSWAAELLRDDPDIDRMITFDAPWFGGSSSLGSLLGLVRSLRAERYDLVVDFRGDLRHLVLARATGARQILGYGVRGGGFLITHEIPYDEGGHEVDRALDLVRSPGASKREPGTFRLSVRPEDEEEAAELFRERGIDGGRLVVALCPTSRNPSRWWRGERFAEVARYLVDRYGAEILVFGDAVSAGVDATLLAPGLRGVHSFVGRTSLPVFAAALGRVDLIVSVESSPIHFASALKKPIVTIFGGSSLAHNWGPYGTVHRIVHRQVACSPCHLIRCPLPEVLCMEAITAPDVTAACAELLEELGRNDPRVAAKLVRREARGLWR